MLIFCYYLKDLLFSSTKMTDSLGDDKDNRSLRIYGREVSEVPCLRTSLLSGIGGGFVGGFVYFMVTSRVKRATDFAVGTFAVTTLGVWCWCRYQWSAQRFKYRQIQQAAKHTVIHEGTEKDSAAAKNKHEKEMSTS